MISKLVIILIVISVVSIGLAYGLASDSISLNCGTQFNNCVVAINREQDKAGEVCFYKDSVEQVCILERYGGVLAIVIRTNNTVHDYALQLMPHGQEIHNYDQFIINENGYYCNLQAWNNGTVKCILGDPIFDSTD